MPLFNIIKKKTIQKNNLRNEGTFLSSIHVYLPMKFRTLVDKGGRYRSSISISKHQPLFSVCCHLLLVHIRKYKHLFCSA